MPRTARRSLPTFHSPEEVRERMAELDAQYPDRNFPEAVREEWNVLARIHNEFETRLEFAQGGDVAR